MSPALLKRPLTVDEKTKLVDALFDFAWDARDVVGVAIDDAQAMLAWAEFVLDVEVLLERELRMRRETNEPIEGEASELARLVVERVRLELCARDDEEPT